jgi:hypothetical protein
MSIFGDRGDVDYLTPLGSIGGRQVYGQVDDIAIALNGGALGGNLIGGDFGGNFIGGPMVLPAVGGGAFPGVQIRPLRGNLARFPRFN